MQWADLNGFSDLLSGRVDGSTNSWEKVIDGTAQSYMSDVIIQETLTSELYKLFSLPLKTLIKILGHKVFPTQLGDANAVRASTKTISTVQLAKAQLDATKKFGGKVLIFSNYQSALA